MDKIISNQNKLFRIKRWAQTIVFSHRLSLSIVSNLALQIRHVKRSNTKSKEEGWLCLNVFI